MTFMNEMEREVTLSAYISRETLIFTPNSQLHLNYI